MIGRVGSDAFGQVLLETLQRDGVETRFVKVDSQAPSGVALIAVDDAGENTIIVASGANARVSPDDVDAAEAIRTTDTHRKEALVRGRGFTVGGMAKGAAMLAPNMNAANIPNIAIGIGTQGIA